MVLKPFPLTDEIICFFGDRTYEYDHVLGRDTLVVENRQIDLHRLCFAEQIHADRSARIPADLTSPHVKKKPNILPGVDALITDQSGFLLCVKYADCIPLMVFDPVQRVVAGIHSGRTGTESNITGKTIDRMSREFGSEPGDLQVAIGPSICADHYEVSEEIFNSFIENVHVDQEYPFLDLKRVVIKQLSDCGVTTPNIVIFPQCTYEDENFYSYRRDGTPKRQISIIGLNNV